MAEQCDMLRHRHKTRLGAVRLVHHSGPRGPLHQRGSRLLPLLSLLLLSLSMPAPLLALALAMNGSSCPPSWPQEINVQPGCVVEYNLAETRGRKRKMFLRVESIFEEHKTRAGAQGA